jgi:hypothetical protein
MSYKIHGRNYNSAGKWNGYLCGNTREQDSTDNLEEITCLRCLNSSNYTKAKEARAALEYEQKRQPRPNLTFSRSS